MLLTGGGAASSPRLIGPLGCLSWKLSGGDVGRTRRGDGVAVSRIAIATARGIARRNGASACKTLASAAQPRRGARGRICQESALIGVDRQCRAAALRLARSEQRCGLTSCAAASRVGSQFTSLKFKIKSICAAPRRATSLRRQKRVLLSTPLTNDFRRGFSRRPHSGA